MSNSVLKLLVRYTALFSLGFLILSFIAWFLNGIDVIHLDNAFSILYYAIAFFFVCGVPSIGYIGNKARDAEIEAKIEKGRSQEELLDKF